MRTTILLRFTEKAHTNVYYTGHKYDAHNYVLNRIAHLSVINAVSVIALQIYTHFFKHPASS